MKKYRIRHIPTGYYYKSQTKDNNNNLVKDKNIANLYTSEKSFKSIVGKLCSIGWEKENKLKAEDIRNKITVYENDFIKEYIDDTYDYPVLWVAKDNLTDGITALYLTKPEKNLETGSFIGSVFMPIPEENFPDLTWENSPKLILLKDILN